MHILLPIMLVYVIFVISCKSKEDSNHLDDLVARIIVFGLLALVFLLPIVAIWIYAFKQMAPFF